LYRDIDDAFRHEHQQEFLKIMALAKVIQYLIKQPAKGKMDIEEFAERCIVDVGNWDVLSIDASLVAEEIARSLEKKGIVKMKGNTIKWKA
jgi:superfamily I DNA and/or RNA helicase